MRPVKIKCRDCINTLHLFTAVLPRMRAEPELYYTKTTSVDSRYISGTQRA